MQCELVLVPFFVVSVRCNTVEPHLTEVFVLQV